VRAALLVLAGAVCIPTVGRSADDTLWQAGVARVDITPDYPIRLSGFASRKTESAGIRQRIWAKALALDDGFSGPVVLLTVDNLGLPYSMVQELARRLKEQTGLDPARLAVTATHTHTAPMLRGVAPTLFGEPIPPEHQERIDRYTRELADKLLEVSLAALKDRRPAKLSWGIGRVTFAVNRRTKDGPVDHDLPMMVISSPQGDIRAIYTSYACHCVTLSDNQISGDWAGYAQESIERLFPGATALVSIGCGADANPSSGVTGDKAELAAAQGNEIATEVQRLIRAGLRPLAGPMTCHRQSIKLDFETLPTREAWQELGHKPGAVGYHARVQLERLDRGEALQTHIDYLVQTWRFGDRLAMVFLPGEVVVDYSLRLKRELDGTRLWINAYSNDSPCYIPSERVLKEGGYEGGGAMIYYDRPTKLKPGLEQSIIDAVKSQAGDTFRAAYNPSKVDSRPLPPEQSLAAMRLRPGLVAELVAAEPLVIDPVAIDFGPDGRLWVAEMYDYPTGLQGNFEPGGRIRTLSDTDGDGRYDKATVFLEGIPFPTGVAVWRNGVLVCAAPDILYAEDNTSDGVADVKRVICTGFATHNYQARVNSLCWGLDNWMYGSGGLFGGEILTPDGARHDLNNRDFRLRPDTGKIEAATGRSQQGRVRDDFDNWFGCENSTLLMHYPLADHYLRRNPHLLPPPLETRFCLDPQPGRLFPIHDRLQFFRLSGVPGKPTAVCGLGIYRDVLLGEEFYGNAFSCEPVNLLIHRQVLEPRGVTFASRRPADEVQSEFLTSTDVWFRPVQVRTGMDGALWVVDMYRYVIEHPRWIPPETLETLDPRAGSTFGRIYRVYSPHRPPRPIPRLDRLGTAELAAAMDSPNGTQRDLVQQMLIWRGDNSAAAKLQELATTSMRPAVRVQALCTLDGLGCLKRDVLAMALKDEHAGVQRHAVRLLEHVKEQDLPDAFGDLLHRVGDLEPQVQHQLAYTLGQLDHSSVGLFLAIIALQCQGDEYRVAAALSSANKNNVAAFVGVLKSLHPEGRNGPVPVALASMAATMGDERVCEELLELAVEEDQPYAALRLELLAAVWNAWERRSLAIDKITTGKTRGRLEAILQLARRLVVDHSEAISKRVPAVALLARQPERRAADIELLSRALAPQNPPELQSAVIARLAHLEDAAAAGAIIAVWDGLGPALRSQVLDALLGRTAWQRELLAAVESGRIAASHLDAARRQRLLQHADEAVQKAAAKLFSVASQPKRAKVLADYQAAARLSGDRARGKLLFQKHCAACHRYQDEGHAVGPDIAALTNKTPSAMLEAIFDPNKAVEGRFVMYTAITDDGLTYQGVLVAETAITITLRQQEGKEHVLRRRSIEALQSSGKSLMPEGMEQQFSLQDAADLLQYLGAAP
jgi:putative membrane-bound dehydrogenase-like protein